MTRRLRDESGEPDAGRPPELSGVVVVWRGGEDLARLVESWPADPRFELVVVLNDASDIEPQIGAAGRRVVFLEPGRNLGFAGGANRGIAAAGASNLLVLNPDAQPEPGALEALAEGFTEYPDAAGLVPRLVGEDGRSQWQWQLRPLPTPGRLLLQALLLDTVSGPRDEPAAGTSIEQPAAAALAMRRSVIEEMGGFDERFFPAWFEDVDLARRLADRGRRLLYLPRAVFRHRLGGTVPSLGYGRFLFVYYRNLIRYLRKHHGRWNAVATQVLVPVGMCLRLLLLALVKPRRARSRGEAAQGLVLVSLGALSGWRLPRSWSRELEPERARTDTGGGRDVSKG